MPTAQNSVLVNRQLQKLGFGTLKDPNLFDQMAMVIRDHQHFRRLLMSVEEGQRHVAYEALASKLRFKAKPLEDYVIESRTLAEQNQLPHYDPKTLAVTEWKPQEIETEEARIQRWRREEKEREDLRLKHISDQEVEYGCNCTSLLGPSEHCEAHGASYRAREEVSRLCKLAEEAIDRDLRESQATQQCTLICAKCTFEQKFRVKKQSAMPKVARSYGWTFNIDGKKAYCRACSKSSN